MLEARLEGHLAGLRIHKGPAVDRAAEAMGARGFALGRHVALSRLADADTLVHEAAHALQQNMAEPGPGDFRIAPAYDPAERAAENAARSGGPVSGGQTLRIQRDLVSPGRLAEVHESVRVTGPPGPATTASGASTRQPWVDPVGSSGGTAAVLEQEAIAFLTGRALRPLKAHTTAQELAQDAVTINRRVLARFPLIPSPRSDTEIQNRTQLSTPSAIRQNQDFLNAWVDNNLHQFTSAEDFDIDTSNPHYRAMVTRLLNHPDVGPLLIGLAARQSAFTTGEGAVRGVFMHEMVSDPERPLTLIHELVHLYRHTRFRDWADASKAPGIYNEGLTEWLARKVMTSAELSGRTTYQDRVDAVEQQIAANVPEDDIARAVFRGEVWRLETRSAEASSAFEAATGIREGVSEAEERAATRTGSGLFQTVVPGDHYRFLNLGFAEAEPKPEHVTSFQQVKAEHLDPDPARKLRFVGHASSPGSLEVNRALSRRRSVAFYRMARREGVPWSQMIDADRPPHFGETRPTVTEEDAITRAMNRRVELFLIGRGT